MKQELWIALLNVFNSENWKALSEQNKKNRNTSVGGVYTCGSRSFTITRKVIEKVTKGPMGSTKFYTYVHTLKATRSPLVQQSVGSANIGGSAGVDGSVEEGGSNGVGGSDGTHGLIGVCGSNDGSQGVCGSNDGSIREGGSTSIEVDVVEPVWVNDKSREHIEKYKACMTKSHGEDVESHPHNQETWNEVTPVKRGITHGAGKSSDLIFVLTGIPSTPHAATSYSPDVVEVLQKSFEELKEARARDKELFKEAKEENRKQYEEKLKAHSLKMKEEMVKEANATIAEMFAQYTQQLPIPPP
ncbi:hypothetical protein Tco_1205817 [Tanacetum coccineum]